MTTDVWTWCSQNCLSASWENIRDLKCMKFKPQISRRNSKGPESAARTHTCKPELHWFCAWFEETPCTPYTVQPSCPLHKAGRPHCSCYCLWRLKTTRTTWSEEECQRCPKLVHLAQKVILVLGWGGVLFKIIIIYICGQISNHNGNDNKCN